jgi:hypothetical protein
MANDERSELSADLHSIIEKCVQERLADYSKELCSRHRSLSIETSILNIRPCSVDDKKNEITMSVRAALVLDFPLTLEVS